MIDFKINRDIINILKQEGFYADTLLTQYFILDCLNKGDTLSLNILDDEYRAKRIIHQYYELVRRGLVKELQDHSGFEITEKGKIFIGKVQEYLPKEVVKEVRQEVEEIPTEMWFEDWMDLFPSGIKSGGKLLRSDKKACHLKMKKFIKEYKYPPELILDATRDYLEEREANDWLYCKCATYLIDKKGEGSELAALCEDYVKKPKNDFIIPNQGGLI